MENTENTGNETNTVDNTVKDPKAILNINVSRIILGLTEIGNLDIDDFDINIGISKTITNLSVAEKAYGKTMQSLMKAHIKTDENGNLATSNNFYIFKSEKDKESYQDALDKLNDTVIEEKVWKMKASDLRKVKGIKGTTMAKCNELIIYDAEKS